MYTYITKAHWAFWGYQWKIPGGYNSKSWNSRGVNQELRKKHGFPGGQCKKIENSRRITVNSTRNPGGSTSKKNRYPQQGGGGCKIFFSGKKKYLNTNLVCFVVFKIADFFIYNTIAIKATHGITINQR